MVGSLLAEFSTPVYRPETLEEIDFSNIFRFSVESAADDEISEGSFT